MAAPLLIVSFAVILDKMLRLTPSIKQHPRGSFTVAEYWSLVRLSRQRIGQRIPCEFTVNSRRGELNLDQYAVISQG